MYAKGLDILKMNGILSETIIIITVKVPYSSKVRFFENISAFAH